MNLDGLKIAIVCDWLTMDGGAEKVLDEMLELFPHAELFTLMYDEKKLPRYAKRKIHTSFLQKIPGSRRFYRYFLPLMPFAIEQFDLDAFDLVISSSHAVAKGVITPSRTLHLCYCHTPMRYAWDHAKSYQKTFSVFSKLSFITNFFLHKIRLWDRLSAERVDVFIANSFYIQKRLEKYYGKSSKVLHPPVNLSHFHRGEGPRNGALAVGRFINYKRFDLAIEACAKLKMPLTIIGEGPEESKLKALAQASGFDGIKFLGKVDLGTLQKAYQEASCLLFPQREDFGIVPLEAMASGTPVIAYGAGGALETVKENISGVFFKEQTVESLAEALRYFQEKDWDAEKIAESVQNFHQAYFRSQLRHYLLDALHDYHRP